MYRLFAALAFVLVTTSSAPYRSYIPSVAVGPSIEDLRILRSISIPSAALAALPDAASFDHPGIPAARAQAERERSAARQAWDKLTPAQQEHIKPFLAARGVRNVIVGMGELPVGGRRLNGDYWNCRWVQFERQILNYFEQIMAGYGEYLQWCYDLSNVVDVPADYRYEYVNVPLWQFNGHLDESKSGGVGQSYYRHYTQGSFCEVWPVTGMCLDSRYPWVVVQGNGDGSNAVDGGG